MKMRVFNHGLSRMRCANACVLAVWCIVCACVMGPMQAVATTWYVTKSGNDSNTGKSESAAFLTIQKAVNSAGRGDTILVGKGTYGYVSVSSAKEPLTLRATESVDSCIIKGASGHRCVEIGAGSTTNVFVIGFTLTGASLSGENYGAGVFGGTCSNCVIKGNKAATYAGGAYKSVLIDCTISDNSASYGVGGIRNCIAERCTISKNTANKYEQGGVTGSELTDCIIESNVGNYGGAVADSTLRRCIIRNNRRICEGGGSGSQGYGVHNCVCYDCLIRGNRGPDGGAVNGGVLYGCTIVENTGRYHVANGYYDVVRGGTFYNCIFGGRSSNAASNTVTGAKFYNSFFWNVHEGDSVTKSSVKTGNPSFVGVNDYRLNSTSPCINAGNNLYVYSSKDIQALKRIWNEVVDIGAYEWQPASATVKNVAVFPRYPWSGMVDLSFTINGDADVAYATTFAAKDVVGGTNLVMKTVEWVSGGKVRSETAPYRLVPGNYRFVWNAVADLPSEFRADRVTIAVEVE